MSKLYANAAKVDITPSLGTIINGEFTSRYANQIADRLYAKAFYLKTDDVKLLFIVVDVCAMKREFLDPIKRKIAERTGIPDSNQLISATHTHSGGSVSDLLLGHADINYRYFLEEKLLVLADLATAKSVVAKIAFGKVDVPEHVTCRRYSMQDDYLPINPVTSAIDQVKTNPFGVEDKILSRTTTPDPEVAYIALKSLEDEWIGVLANYSLHYVGDCERGTITADYFGYFAKQLTRLTGGGDTVVSMSNGTSGEVNIWDFMNGDRYPKENHKKSELIGNDIAERLFETLDVLNWESDIDLACIYRDISLGLRTIAEDDFSRAKAIVTKTDYEAVHYYDDDLMEKLYAREQVLLAEYPESVDFPVQCFKIGDVVIGGLGGEFFSETGLSLKALYPKYFTICFANDYVGYVPPAAEIAKGGYETWRCRSSFLEENAEKIVRRELEASIQSL